MPNSVLRLAVCVTLAVMFVGCGGHSNSVPPLAANAGLQLNPSGTPASDSSAVVAEGTVANVSADGFTLNDGTSAGLIQVYTSAATQFFGPKPYVGESVYANGSGSTETSIRASSVAREDRVVKTSGRVDGVLPRSFLLETGYPHGYINVYLTSHTDVDADIGMGAKLDVVGVGTFETFITATAVSKTSPTVPPPPNGSSTTTLMPQAKTGIGLFQVFDAWGSDRVSGRSAEDDAKRYGVVWGARPGMAQWWLAGNRDVVATYYLPLETDANTADWGGIGHSLSWWQRNRPSWVLYACTADGERTRVPATVGGLSDNVPLDIHNPDVIAYQVKLAANYAIANGYNGLAIDEVVFWDIGGNDGSGAYGCGIYEDDKFIRRYSGERDEAWKDDVVAWVRRARSILNTDPALAPYHLKLVINHPPGSITDPDEQALLANVDADLDETGYSDYGNYAAGSDLFKITTDWMEYAQAHGVAPLIIDDYSRSDGVSAEQIEYSIATYLMGNEGGAGLFAGGHHGYGVQQYHREYDTDFGTRCGGYYGGPDIWYRKYSKALVIVNSGSDAHVADLPSGHHYRDLEHQEIHNPLSVARGNAYVLLTTDGCD